MPASEGIIFVGSSPFEFGKMLMCISGLSYYQQGVWRINFTIKPSISRWHFEKTFTEANTLIRAFLSSEPHATFLDVHSSLLNPDGSVMNDIFLADNLHMNSKGYKIWQSIIQPVLLKGTPLF